MTAAELKASILDQAIRGQLTASWRKEVVVEESAAELLKRIKAEKAKLIAAKKIKKEKPLAPITDDEKPFEIPANWEWCRFGSLLINRDAERIPLSLAEREKQTVKKYDYYGASGVIDKVEGYLFDKPLLLIGEDGANLLTRSTPIAFIAQSGKYWVNNHAHVLDCSISYILKYVEIYINAISLAPYVTGTAQPKMNQEKMNSIPIPLPPLAEQKRIVEKIEELMPLVERYGKAEERRAKLNAALPADLEKSILQEAIQGRLTTGWREEAAKKGEEIESAAELLKRIKTEKAKHIAAKKIKKEKPLAPITDDEKPFDLPEGWEWVRWGDISTSIQYGYNAPAKSSGKVRFVRISDIQNGRVMWETVPFCDIKDDEIDDYLLKPNDILFARTGGTVGKSYIVRDVPEIAIYAGYLIRTRCGSELEPMFFKYFMESDLYWSQLRSGTIATAQPNCNGQTLANMKLPLPPLAEQKEIVAKVEDLLVAVRGLSAK